MCGRYAIGMNGGEVQQTVTNQYNLPVEEVRNSEGHDSRSYNVAPTNYAPVYRKDIQTNHFVIQYMSWGLVPFWTKTISSMNQYKTFNARKESVLDGQRLWKPVRKHNRCVIPVEGYYEWLHKSTGQGKTKVDKIPYFIKRKDKKLIFLAGMFDSVEFKDDDPPKKIDTFTIITGPAPKQMKWLHNRMPIVLVPGTKEWDDWLDDKEWSDGLKSSLAEYGKDDLEWYEVSRDVGKVSNNGEYLVKPLKKSIIGDFFGKPKSEIKKESSEGEENSTGVKQETKRSPKNDILDQLKSTKSVKKEEHNNTKIPKREADDQSIADRIHGDSKKQRTE